jgi:hypothetical protein
VRVETLAALLASHGFERVDFLKLDCEGAEGLILPSLPESLLRQLRCVSLEFHDDVSALRHEALAELFERNGFAVRTHWDGDSPNGYMYASRPG